MNTPESVVGCSSCGALYTPGPGDRGVCLDCRRQAAASQARPPSGITPRPNTATPVRLPSSRPSPVRSALRPNFAKWRALWRIGVAAVVAGGIGTAGVTQRQRISTTWSNVQRHGVSREWTSLQRKGSELWVAIRRQTPWPVEQKRSGSGSATSSSRSSNRDATATRGTSHHTQVAATTTKRKSKRRGSDMNSPGSTP